jgi:hypothetical protein
MIRAFLGLSSSKGTACLSLTSLDLADKFTLDAMNTRDAVAALMFGSDFNILQVLHIAVHSLELRLKLSPGARKLKHVQEWHKK